MSDPIDSDKQSEPNRNRFETREVSVYNDLYGIDTEKWMGIREIIKVQRTVHYKQSDKPSSKETAYFISSKPMSAKAYNRGIRAHWSIENSLHYVKDVTFGEDASLIRTGKAPANFSIIRNIAINLFRRMNCVSFPQAIRLFGGDIQTLGKLLE